MFPRFVKAGLLTFTLALFVMPAAFVTFTAWARAALPTELAAAATCESAAGALLAGRAEAPCVPKSMPIYIMIRRIRTPMIANGA
jgi:hypothetical protein